jgi:hypothetical protein
LAICNDLLDDIMRQLLDTAVRLPRKEPTQEPAQIILQNHRVLYCPVPPSSVGGRVSASGGDVLGLGTTAVQLEVELAVQLDEQPAEIFKGPGEALGPDPAELRGRHFLHYFCIQTAVRTVFPGELAMHAVSEGTKAVTAYSAAAKKELKEAAGSGEADPSSAPPVAERFERSLARRANMARLVFSPESVAAAASAEQSGVLLSVHAAVYLAAVLARAHYQLITTALLAKM